MSRTPNKIKGDVVVAFNGHVTFERTQRVIATVNDVDTRPQDHEIKMLEWWANKGHMGSSMIDVIVATKGEHVLQSDPWEVADKVQAAPVQARRDPLDLWKGRTQDIRAVVESVLASEAFGFNGTTFGDGTVHTANAIVEALAALPSPRFSIEEAKVIYDSARNLHAEGRSDPYTAFMDFLNSAGYRR